MDEAVWDEFDVEIQREPSVTVLLHRSFPTYTETMWINGYPGIRMIVVTCPQVRINGADPLPGAVRELPVGWRDMATAETFRTRVEKHVRDYLDQGWIRKDATVREER